MYAVHFVLCNAILYTWDQVGIKMLGIFVSAEKKFKQTDKLQISYFTDFRHVTNTNG